MITNLQPLKVSKNSEAEKLKIGDPPLMGAAIAADLTELHRTTEEHLLALKSRIPQIREPESNDRNNLLESPIGEIQAKIEKQDTLSTLVITGADLSGVRPEETLPSPVALVITESLGSGKSTNTVFVSELSQDPHEKTAGGMADADVALALEIVEELISATPIVVEKKIQSSFQNLSAGMMAGPEALPISEHPGGADLELSTFSLQEAGNNQDVIALDTVSDTTFVAPEDIASVISTATMQWTFFGLDVVEHTVMLLNNGLAFTNLTRPPGEIELPTSISGENSEWTTWRQTDSGQIYLASDDGEFLLTGEEIDLTPLNNEDIVGVHSHLDSGLYGATMVTSWQDVSFNLDGTFELTSAILTTTGGAGTILTDILTSSFYQHTPQGNYSVFENDTPSELDEVLTSDQISDDEAENTQLFGTFRLLEDGLTIEMYFANGDVRRELIYKGDGYINFKTDSYKTQSRETHYLELIRETGAELNYGVLHTWLSLLADSISDHAKERSNVSSGSNSM